MKDIYIILNLFSSGFLIAQVSKIKSNYCPPLEIEQLATAGNTFDCEGSVDFKGSKGPNQGAAAYFANYPGGPNGIIKKTTNNLSPNAIGFAGIRESISYGQNFSETFEYNFSQVLPPGTYTIELWQAFSSNSNISDNGGNGRVKIYDIFAIPEERAQCKYDSGDIDFYNTKQPVVSYYTDHDEPDFTKKSFNFTLDMPARGLLFTTKYAAPLYPSKNTNFYVTFGNFRGAEITISGTPDVIDDRNIPPTPEVPNQSYCEGSQRPALEVNNPDTTNYTYTWYDESGKEVNEGTSLDYSKLSDPAITSGTFTVTATDKTTNCVSTATKVDLTQYPKPTITLNVNPTCSADLKTYSFTVSSESGNDISTDDNQASIQDNANGTWTIRVPMATAKNTISVTAKNKEGCNMTQPFNKPNCSCPVIPAPNASDEAYCEGSQKPALEVNNPDTTNYTYTWYDESGKEVNEGTSLDYSKLSDPAITSGTFTVTATDKTKNCVSTATKVDLTQYPKPTITLNVNPTCSADLKTYSFTVSSESGNDISTDDNQASIQDNANGTWTIRVPMATAKNTISVTAKNKEGCNMTQPFNKPNCSCPVIPTPNASDEAYCEGSQKPALEVNNPDTTNYTYTWYDESGKEVNEGTSLDYSKLSDPAITSGTFTVTATDKIMGCVSTATKVDLTQYPKPTITLNVNPTCSADLKTYSFTVSSESGNDISTDDNQASIQDNANGTWTIRVPMATAKNTISVTAKNKEGCNMTQPFNKPNCSCPVIPTPNASDEAYCEGSQRPALEVNNPDTTNYTYTWYDESGKEVNEGTSLDYSKLSDPAITSGTFTVTATDKIMGCVSTATKVDLTQYPKPTITLNVNPTCSADLKTYSFTVSSESGNDISTDDNQASIQDNANGTWTIRVPMATAKNTISVTAKNKEGCNMTQPFNKPNCSCPVIPTPNASDEAYCEGSQRPALEVNNPDTTNYTYTWYDESGKEVNEGTSLDYSKLSDPAITSGTFTVTATDKTTNCVSTATKVDLTQYPKPTITLNVNPTCSADLKTYSFTVSSESGNDISTDDNQASIQDNANGTWTIRVPMATAKNTISVTAKNKEGCNMTQPFNKPNCSCPVIPTPNASDEAYCEGSQKPALEVSNPNVNYTYTWYDSSGTSVYTGVKFSPSVSSGTFTVTATDKTKNCVSTATTVKLIENPQPTLSVTANHPVLFYGQPFKLYSNPSSDSSYKLSWKGPNGFRSQQENPVIPSVHSNHSGTYELNLSNTLNCSAASQFSLQVYTDVETALGEDVISCSDGTSFTFSYPQVSGLTYLWSGPNNFSSTQNQITVNETGIYTLTVRASDGNESVGSVQIKASDLRVEKLNTCLAQTIVNPSGGRPPYEYSLDGVTFQSSPVFKGDFRTAHTIYVRDGNSCEVREEAKGVKFDLYEAFSPNGDGINDRWDLSALSGCVKAQVKIFDRYGRYVHLMQLNNLSWDGRVKGKPLPSGTYWYVIEFNDGVTPLVKGNLTIKRRKD